MGRDAMSQTLTIRMRARRMCAALFTPQIISSLATGSGLTLAAMSWLATYGLGLSVALATVIAFCGGVTLARFVGTQQIASHIPSWSRWLAVTCWLGLMPVWITIGNI